MATNTPIICKYKRLAKQRLDEGRLIKDTNIYTPNMEYAKQLLEKQTDPELRDIYSIILQNVLYIGFNELLLMLMDGFKQFLDHIQKKSYTLVFNRDNNKSDIWVILLILRYGNKILGKENYYDPVNIIEMAKPNEYSKDMIYLLCDDCIYSGTQMRSNITNLKGKFPYKTKSHIYVVCAGASTYGLENCMDIQVFYSKKLDSFKEIIQASPEYKSRYCSLKSKLNYTFPQPFIEKFNYMNNIPMYMEHKMPDAMSSFPRILVHIVNKCKWEKGYDHIDDGSNEFTMCAHPFYKSVNMEKGANDAQRETDFINKLVNAK